MNEEKIPKATHDGNLKIGDAEIKCAVLDDGRKIMTRATFIMAMGRKGKAKGGREYDDEFRTPVFLSANNLQPFISQELEENSKPVIFNLNGKQAIGYKAELLPQVCSVFLDADDNGALLSNQKHIAQKCKILIRGFATVGIVALVDEATGYQYDRARHDLEEILEKFISGELNKWAKTFPDDFYRELFRLRGWQFMPLSIKRPALVGKLTNDLVYERLAPAVLDELKRLNPKNEKGHRKHRHHQWLTSDIGHPRLREHIASVIALMKASSKWDNFKRGIERALPKYGQVPLPFPIQDDE